MINYITDLIEGVVSLTTMSEDLQHQNLTEKQKKIHYVNGQNTLSFFSFIVLSLFVFYP